LDLLRWLLWWGRSSSSWLLLLAATLLVDLVLDLIEQAQRLVGGVARLESVQSLLEALLLRCRLLLLLQLGSWLLLLWRECRLLLPRRGLLLSLLERLLLLRDGLLLLLLREGLLLLLLREGLLLLLLLRSLLLEGFGLRIDEPKLRVAGKGRDRLATFIQRSKLRNPDITYTVSVVSNY
jgi:hypothetical protein